MTFIKFHQFKIHGFPNQKTNGFDILGTKFLHENVKCYELKQVRQQNDFELINILNIFQTTSQAYEDINFINKFCCK